MQQIINSRSPLICKRDIVVLENFFHDFIKTVDVAVIDLVVNFSFNFFGPQIFGKKVLLLNEVNLFEAVGLQHVSELNDRELSLFLF